MPSKTMLPLLRTKMKEMYEQLTPHEQFIFRKMYDHKNIHEHPVDGVSIEKFDWAFTQIENSLNKESR